MKSKKQKETEIKALSVLYASSGQYLEHLKNNKDKDYEKIKDHVFQALLVVRKGLHIHENQIQKYIESIDNERKGTKSDNNGCNQPN